MSSNPFATPAPPGSGINWQELLGLLLVIEPIAQETGIKTAYGESDAVRADVVVLEGDEPGKEYLDTLVFPKVLGGQLSRSIGQKVLGRLGQGTAKPGQSPPWMLLEASAQDIELGQRYLASRAQQVTAPAPVQDAAPQGQQPAPQPQPAAQQWGQQPAQQPAPQQQGAHVPF